MAPLPRASVAVFFAEMRSREVCKEKEEKQNKRIFSKKERMVRFYTEGLFAISTLKFWKRMPNSLAEYCFLC